MIYAGGPAISMSQDRAAQLKAAGHIRFDKDPVPDHRPAGGMLQQEGRPNAEPTPTPYPGDPITPAPGAGAIEHPELGAALPVQQGRTNAEPEPDTSTGSVSPAPGTGTAALPVQGSHVAPERARMKVIENRAPNDPGATIEDNYAIPLAGSGVTASASSEAVEVSPAASARAKIGPEPAAAARGRRGR